MSNQTAADEILVFLRTITKEEKLIAWSSTARFHQGSKSITVSTAALSAAYDSQLKPSVHYNFVKA